MVMPRALRYLGRDLAALSVPARLFMLVALVFLATLPFLGFSSFFRAVMIQLLLFAFLATGWNTIGGYGGQVDIGQAQFLAIGAYTTSMSLVWWNLPPWVSAPIGMGLAVLWCLVIGFPLFLLKGHYFAIATIAAALVLKDLFSNWELIHASRGVHLPLKQAPSLLYLQFHTNVPMYYVILVLFLAGLVFLNWFRNDRLGYQLRAVKENDEAARSLGIDVRAAKLKAYAIAASFAALGGAFHALYTMYIDPEAVMATELSMQIALMAMLGGVGTLWGPVIGAAILVPLDRFLGSALGGKEALQGLDLMIYGGIIMLLAVVEPRGIMGLLGRATKANRRRER
jgi:branched-chain amino acid transport system permease protein